jgi:glycerol-3-phosphate acyltransferase PlsY
VTIHWLWKVLLVVGAYLLGSVPFGLILSRAVAGVDVRQVGSGNIGATNVSRAAGKPLGIVTLLLDAAKAAVPVLLAIMLLAPEGSATMDRWVVAVGLGAFFGHLFPVWLGFRGGKGVATALGLFLVLAPWPALAGVATFAAVVALTRIVSLGSLAGTAVCAGGTFAQYGAASPICWAGLAVTAAIALKHRGNIRRLLRGEERRI